MLVHPHDRPLDAREWRDFVAAQSFGHFIAPGRDRDVPVVAPTQFVLTDDGVEFHLAAINPVFDALSEHPRAMMSVAGDWAYVPAAFKAIGEEDPRRQIPTTYYAAAQITGDAQIIRGEGLAAILRTQLAAFEPGSDVLDPLEHRNKLRAIRGIRLPLEQVVAKFKFGGNVDHKHRSAVAERLRERGGPGDEAALTHLLRRL